MNNNEKIEEILNVLIEKMELCVKNGEVPVAAVIVDSNFNVIGYCGNERQHSYNVLGHAEILAIQQAELNIKDWRLNGYCMYVSLMPCEMCRVVIKECRLDKVYYLCDRNEQCSDILFEKIIGFDEYELKSRKILTDFFNNMR